MKYWLIKSEPSVYSIDDLAKAPNQTDYWNGIRSEEIRRRVRDDMRRGDLIFFYHGHCDAPGIVGIAEIVKGGYPDQTQFNPESEYFDSRSDPADPKWFMVDLQLKETFKAIIPLDKLRSLPELQDLAILKGDESLEITPVTEAMWKIIFALR
jgi:predicted RNA-binding protein with PUA-like domain